MHERSLQQTSDQIAQVEQQIYSIEAANINQETLNAMKTAGKAMKDIHGNLTIDKVDATMYVVISCLSFHHHPFPTSFHFQTSSSTTNPPTHSQGRTPRTTRTRRRDRQRHHQRPHRRPHRRRRPGGRTRRHGARGHRRTHAQDRDRPCC